MRLLQFIALISISFAYIQSCCLPSVFEVTIINTLIAEENSTYQQKLYFNEEIKKAAISTNKFGHTEHSIIDESTKKRYFIIDENVCDVTDLKEPLQKICLPQSRVFMGSTVLDNDYNNLTVDNYYVNKSQGNSFSDINYMTIPLKGGVCTLLKTSYQNDKTTLTREYINFTFEIADKSVFKPPKQCNEINNRGNLLTTSLFIILLIHYI